VDYPQLSAAAPLQVVISLLVPVHPETQGLVAPSPARRSLTIPASTAAGVSQRGRITSCSAIPIQA